MRHALVVLLGCSPSSPAAVHTRGAPLVVAPVSDAAVAVDAAIGWDGAVVDGIGATVRAPDHDGDGIADVVDACPTTAGAPSTDSVRAGCPGLVELRGAELVLLEPIRFEIDKATIVPASLPLVDAIGDGLRALGCERVEISGHRDRDAREVYAIDITQRRAKSVVAALIQRSGVPAETLVAVGYGDNKPLTLGRTPAERARNRRIEVRLLECTSLGVQGVSSVPTL